MPKNKGGRGKIVPAELAKLHGHPSRTPHAKRAPVQPRVKNDRGATKAAPRWLSPEQRASWRYAVRFATPGLVRNLDREALATWIVAADLHRQAVQMQAALAKQFPATMGLLVKLSPTGSARPSPYLKIIHDQAMLMLRAAAELGFTPAARTRVAAAQMGLGDLPAPKAATDEGGEQRAPVKSLDDYLDSDPDAATRH